MIPGGQALRRQPVSVEAGGCYQSQLCHPQTASPEVLKLGQHRICRVLGLFLHPGGSKRGILGDHNVNIYFSLHFS